jgi:thioredoxin reductase
LGIRPLLLDRTGEAGGLLRNAWRIENYPGLEPMSGRAFTRHLREFVKRFDLPVTRGEVHGLELVNGGVRLQGDFGNLKAQATILASGTEPHRPPIPGLAEPDAGGLFFEVGPLLQALPRGGRVAILGGGEAACDYALHLAEHDFAVTMLLRDRALRARGRLAELVGENQSIAVRTGVSLRRASTHTPNCQSLSAAGARSKIGMTLQLVQLPAAAGGATALDAYSLVEVIKADALLIAVGRESTASRFLDPLGLRVGEGIATQDPRVMVIGDARAGFLGQLGIAVGDGLAAAMAAAREVDR